MLISHCSLLLFAAGAAVVLVIPDPAVTYVISYSVAHGRAAGLAAVLGISAGTLCHLAAATLGLSALLVSPARALQLIRYLGAAYLVYLGIRTLCRDDAECLESARAERPMARIVGEGPLVNLVNPKIALFFLAFLAQFVDPARSHAALQILELGILFVLLSWCSDSAYALSAGWVADCMRGRARMRGVERNVSGGTFIALGLASTFSRGKSN